MYTINLEESLVKNKKKLLSKEQEFTLRKAAEQESKFDNAEDLKMLRNKLGMLNVTMDSADRVKEIKLKLSKFDQSRLFSEEEIKTLCVKYGLRFLPAEKYNGDVDAMLPKKIVEFEKEYGLSLDRHRYPAARPYIAAPMESFSLQERPVDPLFFAEVQPGFYYLIHKWGNDISAWRYIRNIPKRSSATLYVATAFFIMCLLWIALFFMDQHETSVNSSIKHVPWYAYLLIGVIGGMLLGVFCAPTRGNDETWNDTYRD